MEAYKKETEQKYKLSGAKDKELIARIDVLEKENENFANLSEKCKTKLTQMDQ